MVVSGQWKNWAGLEERRCGMCMCSRLIWRFLTFITRGIEPIFHSNENCGF
jgi:hypothetical protein